MSVPLFRYICVLGYTCIRSSYYVSVFKRIAGAKRNYNSDRNTCTCTYSVFCGIEVSREYEAYYNYLFFCTQGTGNGFLFSFNPISGEPVDTPPTGQVLNYRITQTSMLGELDDHFLRGILLMDPDNQVRPLPTHTFQCYLDRSLNMCKLRQY